MIMPRKKKQAEQSAIKKPIKPHDVSDIWSLKVQAQGYREDLDEMAEYRKDFEAEINRLQALLMQIDDFEQAVADWHKDVGNIDQDYMDFDDALNVFVGLYKRGSLHRNDSRLHFEGSEEKMRLDLDGEMNRPIIMKALRSTGSTYWVGFEDGTFDHTFVTFRPEIKTYILSHKKESETES